MSEICSPRLRICATGHMGGQCIPHGKHAYQNDTHQFTNRFCPSGCCRLVEDACDSIGRRLALPRPIVNTQTGAELEIQEQWLSTTHGLTLMRFSVVTDATSEGRCLTRGTAPTFQSTSTKPRREAGCSSPENFNERIQIASIFGLKQQGS